MNVGIDGRSLAGVQARRGVAHYTASLAGALAAGFPEDSWRLLVLGDRLDAPPPGRGDRRAPHPARGWPSAPRRSPGARGWTAWSAVGSTWSGSPRPRRWRCRATCPSCSRCTTCPSTSAPGTSRRTSAPGTASAGRGDLARRADRVMADSRTTRESAIAMWDLDPARVAVVTPGVTRPAAPLDAEEARRRLGLPARYLLFVGALEPRKGAGVLARAYVRARRARLDAELVLVGYGRSGVVFDALQGIHRIRAADRPELDALYAGALALVMPSLAGGLRAAAARGRRARHAVDRLATSRCSARRWATRPCAFRPATRRRWPRRSSRMAQRRRAARTPRRRGRGRDRGLHLGGGGRAAHAVLAEAAAR